MLGSDGKEKSSEDYDLTIYFISNLLSSFFVV